MIPPLRLTPRTASISPDVANPGYRAVTFDDLRIACDEAFNLLTHQSQLIQHLVLSCELKEGFLLVRLSVERAFASQMCTPVDPEVAHLIIGTLVTDVHLEGDSCGIYSVHMKVPAGAA